MEQYGWMWRGQWSPQRFPVYTLVRIGSYATKKQKQIPTSPKHFQDLLQPLYMIHHAHAFLTPSFPLIPTHSPLHTNTSRNPTNMTTQSQSDSIPPSVFPHHRLSPSNPSSTISASTPADPLPIAPQYSWAPSHQPIGAFPPTL